MRSAWYVLVCTRSLVSQVFPGPQIFQILWLMTMSIAAAWMYRSLQDFSIPVAYDIHSSPYLPFPHIEYGPSRCRTYESPRTGGAKISIKGTRLPPSGPIPLSQISVDVQTYHDDSLMPNTSDGIVNTGSTEI